jgi:hypothetical protein
MIGACQCPNCGLKYPLQADINDLLQFAEQFPQSIPLDEIAVERVKSIGRRGGGREQAEKPRRTVDVDPRGKIEARGKTRATDAYYEEEEEPQRQRSAADAAAPLLRADGNQRGRMQRSPVGSDCFIDGEELERTRQRSADTSDRRRRDDDQGGALSRLLPGRRR